MQSIERGLRDDNRRLRDFDLRLHIHIVEPDQQLPRRHRVPHVHQDLLDAARYSGTDGGLEMGFQGPRAHHLRDDLAKFDLVLADRHRGEFEPVDDTGDGDDYRSDFECSPNPTPYTAPCVRRHSEGLLGHITALMNRIIQLPCIRLTPTRITPKSNSGKLIRKNHQLSRIHEAITGEKEVARSVFQKLGQRHEVSFSTDRISLSADHSETTLQRRAASSSKDISSTSPPKSRPPACSKGSL